MTAGGSAISPRDGDSFSGNHTFHIYETSNAAETARQVSISLKNASPDSPSAQANPMSWTPREAAAS